MARRDHFVKECAQLFDQRFLIDDVSSLAAIATD